MLAATTPLARKKSGASLSLAAMSRLPTRTACTGRRWAASSFATRSSLKNGSTSTAISAFSGAVCATTTCS